MKTTGLNFLEAVQAMNDCKKVKRHRWSNNTFLFDKPCYGVRVKTEKSDCGIDNDDILATDWQIVEEKKTLSDKIDIEVPLLAVNDVKEALKEFLDYLADEGKAPFMVKAKSIFGSRLVD